MRTRTTSKAQQMFEELLQDNPEASEQELRKLFMDAARNDPEMRDAVLEHEFSELWPKAIADASRKSQ
jgi:hypothetical protein